MKEKEKNEKLLNIFYVLENEEEKELEGEIFDDASNEEMIKKLFFEEQSEEQNLRDIDNIGSILKVIYYFIKKYPEYDFDEVSIEDRLYPTCQEFILCTSDGKKFLYHEDILTEIDDDEAKIDDDDKRENEKPLCSKIEIRINFLGIQLNKQEQKMKELERQGCPEFLWINNKKETEELKRKIGEINERIIRRREKRRGLINAEDYEEVALESNALITTALQEVRSAINPGEIPESSLDEQ